MIPVGEISNTSMTV